tara:strand:+ start:170 stop:286 length:117 start_codon:yes stop_codon:yes gene_type:complete
MIEMTQQRLEIKTKIRKLEISEAMSETIQRSRSLRING